MKFATLVVSTLFAAAIASPVVNVDEQQPDPAADTSKSFSEIRFSPPFNWRPGNPLMASADTTFGGVVQGTSAQQWASFLRVQCERVSSCKSFAGHQEGVRWVGAIFKRTAQRGDFIRSPAAAQSFAYTTLGAVEHDSEETAE